MYAIVDDRGKQYRMVPGEEIVVDRLDAEEGAEIRFDKVLLLRTDEEAVTGAPYVEGAVVVAELVEHEKGEKIIVGKFKRRKNYRRKTGHRQPYSRLRVKEIVR